MGNLAVAHPAVREAAVITRPDGVMIIDELPHTATGKIQKLELRRLYGAEAVDGALPL